MEHELHRQVHEAMSPSPSGASDQDRLVAGTAATDPPPPIRRYKPAVTEELR
jgi:hypothetical protein